MCGPRGDRDGVKEDDTMTDVKVIVGGSIEDDARPCDAWAPHRGW